MYLNFSFFTVFLKYRNISSKIKRSKVTDYAALKGDFSVPICLSLKTLFKRKRENLGIEGD